jgi:hypothetical protein
VTILFYTPQITNRLRYVAEALLEEALGLKIKYTTDEAAFLNTTEPKIYYGYQPQATGIAINAAGLLFEKGIKTKLPEFAKHNNVPVIFENDNGYSLPFDIFSATFYFISRYEEYLPFKADVHGRFSAEESFAYKNHFLEVPVVDYYIIMLKQLLQQQYPTLRLKQLQFEFIPTYDIDSAYAHKNKGFVRNMGSLFLSLSKGNFSTMKNLLQVVFNLKPDPFDTYDMLHQWHKEFKLKPIYFFLVGDYDSFDKNISIHISEFKTLIKSVADEARVGIHPSYASNTNTEKLTKEIKRLSSVLNRDIKLSRQHFLKLRFPETYQHLLANDITDDYTMGYSSQPGFRASYSRSFFFYNIETETKTNLRIHPFAFMDATFQYYHEITPRQSLTFILPIIEKLKEVNGTCISLSHNASFFDQKHWIGWKEAYETILKTAVK